HSVTDGSTSQFLTLSLHDALPISMQVLTVNLDDRSYPIYIGEQLLSRPELIARHIRGKQVCVVTNETIAPLYLDSLIKGLAGVRSEEHTSELQSRENLVCRLLLEK